MVIFLYLRTKMGKIENSSPVVLRHRKTYRGWRICKQCVKILIFGFEGQRAKW